MIQQTTNYEVFKKREKNRNIVPKNLATILNSISASNLLHLRPIIVNSNFEVLDGQHRLEAARILEIPIYYQIEEEMTDEDMILLNVNQKTWKLEDYLSFYCAKNNKNYLELKEFITSNALDLHFGLKILGQSGGTLTNAFKAGKYTFSEDKNRAEQRLFQLKKILEILGEKFIGQKKFIQGGNFKVALINFISRKDVFFDTFEKKLLVNLQWIRVCSRAGDYFTIFKSIYNYKNHNPID